MLTHQPPELLRDGKMWPAGDIYRCVLGLLGGRRMCGATLLVLWVVLCHS